MTFAKANKKQEEATFQPTKPCSQCNSMTKQEDLIKFGTMCFYCFQSYCRQAPAYMPELDKHRDDSRGWAKRIIDKNKAGIFVNQVALKMAKDAVGSTYG